MCTFYTLLSSIEGLLSSVAQTSSTTFQTKSSGKRDLGHNDAGVEEQGRARDGDAKWERA